MMSDANPDGRAPNKSRIFSAREIPDRKRPVARVISDPCTLYGARCSVIELPGGVNDSPCHEKVDYSCFSALCSGDDAGFLRERFRR
jgi:hypothetical protein